MICRDADGGGDLHGRPAYLFGVHLRMLNQGLGRRLGVGSAGTNSQNTVIRLNHIAGATKQQRTLMVCGNQKGLKFPEHLVGAPALRELQRRARQVPRVGLELLLQPLEEREGVLPLTKAV